MTIERLEEFGDDLAGIRLYLKQAYNLAEVGSILEVIKKLNNTKEVIDAILRSLEAEL